jgi:hypothetical protein
MKGEVREMLRFILKRSTFNPNDGMAEPHVGLFTVDADVPEIENHLRSGGRGSFGHDLTTLVGVEVLTTMTSSPMAPGEPGKEG